MRAAALLPFLILATACGEEPAADFSSPAWDDGKAVLCVYRGRFEKYGTWRDAEVRDYLVREYLHPEELTKRDEVTDGLIPVLKCNRQVAFNAGSYDYRLMASLFFVRADGALLKAVGTSQEGCGITSQRWDRASGLFRWDSYWEGEGRGERPLALGAAKVFFDELFWRARLLAPGTRVEVMPSLTRNRIAGAEPVSGTIAREGATTRVERDGKTIARYTYDAQGFLESWTIEGCEEFRRVVKRRSYYWQHNEPADRKLLEPE